MISKLMIPCIMMSGKKTLSRTCGRVENLEEVAKHLAQMQARFGVSFIEGFGHVKRNGKLMFGFEDFDEKGDWLPEDKRRQPAPGLNIFIDSEDDDIEFNITEITTEGGVE